MQFYFKRKFHSASPYLNNVSHKLDAINVGNVCVEKSEA
jgi:hypothetical protein